MIPLKSRRELSSTLLDFDLFKDHIRCPELKDKMIINSYKHHTKFRKMFLEKLHRTIYAYYYNPINECIKGMNGYSNIMYYDAAISRESFKKKILYDMKKLFDI